MASVEGAEALTTIALVLAIVAFTIQIFLFVVQSQAASEQRVRSEQLNTQTRALLAEVRTTAQATQGMVSQQFNQLLQAFVTGTAQTAEETKFDPVRLEQRLLTNVRAAMQPPVAAASASDAPSTPVAQPRQAPTPNRATRELAAERVRQRRTRPARMKSFPPEEDGLEAMKTLQALSPAARQRLRSLAKDEITATESGSYVGLDPDEPDGDLEAKDLVTRARVDLGGGNIIDVTRLTDSGVGVIRPLTAIGDVPAWARTIPEDRDEAAIGADDDIPF